MFISFENSAATGSAGVANRPLVREGSSKISVAVGCCVDWPENTGQNRNSLIVNKKKLTTINFNHCMTVVGYTKERNLRCKTGDCKQGDTLLMIDILESCCCCYVHGYDRRNVGGATCGGGARDPHHGDAER